MVAGLVDQHVILTREEPGERAGRELVPTFAEQIGGGATDDEVDLELVMPMRARSVVAGGVSDHPSIGFVSQPEVHVHRKKR